MGEVSLVLVRSGRSYRLTGYDSGPSSIALLGLHEQYLHPINDKQTGGIQILGILGMPGGISYMFLRRFLDITYP